ncbi:thiolase family protein [Novosphingobium mangrovi (ex Hu et al. 2023)]|uniref:Thiolase family protein n=1 Tax=Novosphingobium mangrovi (ex Hu et al. 2023) TaxID=2930094 RepID=A0ABT0AEL9_9SPHN|nr:thiolase family protein [Novosphingobium mangrovi (ex Hu et al. 2023)]MCJ1961643.1 thiolase family protein [Novosphingobium mangrovi (ex Hu et al. 2023)]
MARGEAYITGIGMSEVGVRLERHPLLLTLDAVREALADAGLKPEQIDGVATYPGKMPSFLGFSPVSSDDVIEALGLTTRWHLGGAEMTAQLGAISAAAMAVKAGRARHVLCFRTVYEAAAMANPADYPPPRRTELTGASQWTAPFFAISAATWVAQYATRHMARYGMTREQLSEVALNAHRNAARNPRALVKEPLSAEKYFSARMISSPFCLYDCDRFTDASTVVIVSAGEALDEVTATPIRIAASAGSVERYSWDQAEWPGSYPTGKALWEHCDYGPEDIDVAQFYDGFAFHPITWLEGLGVCGIGEGHRFIEGGTRIALDGELPLNTGGGQLGAGRLHGFGFAHESVVQLRGEGGARQVPGSPRVAVATSGGGPMAAALLLTRES